MTVLHFFRHANAEGSDDLETILATFDYQTDLERGLTEKGMRQAQLRQDYLGDLLFDLCIVSPAKRCRQTAQRLIGYGMKIPIIELPTLYPSPEAPNGKLMWKTFRRLLYEPLSAYLKSEAAEIILQNGVENGNAIKRIIAEHSPAPRNVLIVDHAVTLQAAGSQFTSDIEIFNFKVGEAEGFKIEMNTGEITLLGPIHYNSVGLFFYYFMIFINLFLESISTLFPVLRTFVAIFVPTIQGIFNSLANIEA